MRVSGALHLLPKNVQAAAYKAMKSTQHNRKAILNIYFPYTSRNEMSTAMLDIAKAVKQGKLLESDVNPAVIEKCLFIGDLPPLEVLVRTSGEIRLSDFMLWQVSENCLIHFTSVLWPEFSFWDLLKVIYSYQRNYKRIHKNKEMKAVNPEREHRISKFVEDLREKRMRVIIS